MPFRIRFLACAIALACAIVVDSASENAADEDTAEDENDTETLTVVATRTENSADEVPATVSVITEEEIDRKLARTIQDLVRYEPGVSVGGTGSRFGLDGFTIRGIGGNRVLTTVDGISLPDEFEFGPFLNSDRDYVDIDLVDRVEIVRGPVSALYGSDALGGVVSFVSKTPADLIKVAEDWGRSTKLGYLSASGTLQASAKIAKQLEGLSFLAGATQSNGSERETQGLEDVLGHDRTEANPQSWTTTSGLIKFQMLDGSQQSLTGDLEVYSSAVDTKVLSAAGTTVMGTVTDKRDAEDTRDRTRLVLGYQNTQQSRLFSNLSVQLFRQTSATEQLTFESQTSLSLGTLSRTRSSRFQQTSHGLSLHAERAGIGARVSHRIAYGAEFVTTFSEGLNDGRTYSPVHGIIHSPFSVLPTRGFPNTEVRETGVYVQDEIRFPDLRMTVVPSVRWDSFSATPEPDSVYRDGNPGQPEPVPFSDSEITTRLGLTYDASESCMLFAYFAQGFRAPSYADVNVGFTNFALGYKTIPSPNLKSETSTGTEFGARYGNETMHLSLSGYINRYSKFISTLALAPRFLPTRGLDPADGLLTFQSINLGDVSISGLESRGTLNLNDRWAARFSFARAYGEVSGGKNPAPLSSVDPATLVLGLEANVAGWSGELIATIVAAKDESRIDPSDLRPATDDYRVVDLLVSRVFGERMTVHFGVFNLLNETYLRWADTLAIGEDHPNRFTQPGTNFAFNLRTEW